MKRDLHQRFRLIELIAYWEGRSTTNHLCESFGIGRQQASKDINFYTQYISETNLVYDRSLKGYIPSDSFEPKFIQGSAQEFLNLLSSQEACANIFSPIEFTSGAACSLPIPVREVNAEHVRKVLLVAKSNLRLEIAYRSMNNPMSEKRVIVPHAIVCTPLRWHVRAYCEKSSEYRDFILSRFQGVLEILDVSPHVKEYDKKWQQCVDIVFAPDPRLTKEQRALVSYEYDMHDGTFVVQCRSALVRYTLHALNVFLDFEDTPVSLQQLIVVNRDELAKQLT
ncbi:WYL domain-containing protein [Vibrio atypicus]|uniref:WYL domain-containing protein n=1 Tax=Vibrio atypicus TaxID=558271 RepID=UPI00135CDC45|nr:WYL domain-containing protein [Vibrio atypicus]